MQEPLADTVFGALRALVFDIVFLLHESLHLFEIPNLAIFCLKIPIRVAFLVKLSHFFLPIITKTFFQYFMRK